MQLPTHWPALAPVRGVVRMWRRSAHRATLRFGSFRRIHPMYAAFGYGHGELRVGRYYIDKFLSENATDIRGRVLEVGDRSYTSAFGGERVTQSDVLHRTPGNLEATIVGDLTDATQFREGVFDCFICTQTLQSIYDPAAAIRTIHRILNGGGVVLATMHGISQISRYDMDRWGDYWRFTSRSARQMFEAVFGKGNVTVDANGNVLAAVAALHGISARELTENELDYCDPDYEVLITVRAVKK